MLYVPGQNPRALEKAARLPADALILDLEDAVHPEAKGEAREAVQTAVESGRYGSRETVVRINGLDTEWGRPDLEAMADGARSLDAVLLPKVEDPSQLVAAASVLKSRGAKAELGLMAMIETPMGVLRVADIAAATPQLICLVVGTNDLEALIGFRPTPDRLPLLNALSTCILAARAHGVGIVDGVHTQLDDPKGFEAACQQGRDLGFDGKSLIHPSQIGPANRVFHPSPPELQRAHRVVQAFEEARAAGRGVTTVDGQLVEELHVRIAQRTVAFAEAVQNLTHEAERST